MCLTVQCQKTVIIFVFPFGTTSGIEITIKQN